MNLRTPVAGDSDRLRRLYIEAFDGEEAGLVAELAVELLMLRRNPDPESLHLVAEIDGGLAGHVAFSPVTSDIDGSPVGFILAPLAVAPGQQKQGIGSTLVRKGLRQLADRDVGVVFVYGDPAYYARFGFCRDLAERYVPPFALKFPHGWQACDLGGAKAGGEPVPIRCVGPLDKPELW